jgi:hypothetical protein
MPIKKRSALPDPNAVYDEPKLVIVAREKKPMPEAFISKTYGDNPTPAQLRRLGPLAQACGNVKTDERFNVADRITLLRTPYDTKNPQEQRYRNRIKNRATAITAMCVTCQGSRKAVTECLATACPLWAFRFGGDPFHGKRG